MPIDLGTILVTALVLGTASGLKEVSAQAIKDSYAALRNLIKSRYKNVPIDSFESNPADSSQQEIVQQELEKAGADQDQELLEQAQKVLEAVKAHDPETAGNILISLQDGEFNQNVDIDTLIAEAGSINIDVSRAKVGGSFKIKGCIPEVVRETDRGSSELCQCRGSPNRWRR